MIAAADRAAVADFLARLQRLDPNAVVRLRPDSDGGGHAWAMLPFRVLVARRLTEPPPADVTVGAADLSAALAADGPPGPPPARRDEAWRWPVPSSAGRVIETVPAAAVVRLAAAAARTVRDAMTEGVGGRTVGERALRDALLDHVAIVVTTEAGEGPDGTAERVEIPQRMVQALVRTGLLGPDLTGVTTDTASAEVVTVRRAIGWIGLASRYGSAWYRPISPLRLN